MLAISRESAIKEIPNSYNAVVLNCYFHVYSVMIKEEKPMKLLSRLTRTKISIKDQYLSFMRLPHNMYAIVLSLLLLLGLAYLDLVTGYDLGFFVFYFIPISIIAWYAGRPFAIIISFLAVVAWLIVDKLSGHPYSNWFFPYWNGFVRWTSFVMLAIAISQIKSMLEKEKKLKLDLSQALDKIRQYVAVAKKVAEGDLSISLPVFEGNKTDTLDETFNFMLKRLAEQKNLEKRLFELERQTIMAETASHLAHEIRNPLNLIMLTAHHIGNQFIPTGEPQRRKFDELIASLKSEVEHLSKVVSDFMAMGKPTELKKIKFPIINLIKQIQVLVKQQLLSKGITIECTGDSGVNVYADPEQMRLVFLNLFVNAIAAVPANGKVRFHAASDMEKRQTRFTISDNGPGIEHDDLDKIFEPYFTRKPDGTGLGLALVKRVLDNHNGSIAAANSETGGARFEIVLPLEE